MQYIKSIQPSLNLKVIDDLRQLIAPDTNTTSHTPRQLHRPYGLTDEAYVPPCFTNQPQDSSLIFHLLRVPLFITHNAIRCNLTYYSDIINIQDCHTVNPHYRECNIIFDCHAKVKLLEAI